MASSVEDAPPEFLIDEMPLDEEHDPDNEATPAEAMLVPLEEFQQEKEHAAGTGGTLQGFIVRPLGGRWTEENIGEEWGRYGVMAKKQLPSKWCQLYHWPTSRTWAKNKYGGPDAVRMLAFEWGRKASFFYKLWLADHCSETFSYEQCVLDLYSEEEEYIDWALSLDITSEAFAMVMEIKNFMPCVHPDHVHAEASSSTGKQPKKKCPSESPKSPVPKNTPLGITPLPLVFPVAFNSCWGGGIPSGPTGDTGIPSGDTGIPSGGMGVSPVGGGGGCIPSGLFFSLGIHVSPVRVSPVSLTWYPQ